MKKRRRKRRKLSLTEKKSPKETYKKNQRL